VNDAALGDARELAEPRPADDPVARLEHVVERFGPAIQRMLPAYEQDSAARQDLRQEVLVALWRALPGFRGDGSLRAFVHRVAHNAALRYRRDRARSRRRTDRAAEHPVTPAPAVDERVEQRQTLARLHAHVRTLPDVDRQLLLLYLEGVPGSEIAEITGLSRTNVTTRVGRLRARLHEHLAGPPTGETP
jgi:RNA polymerase sigma factor (sigma-70 family)